MDDMLGTRALVLFSLWAQPCTYYTAGAEDRAWKALGLDLGALLENAYLAQSAWRAREPRECEPCQESIPKWVWLWNGQAWAWVQSLALGWFWSKVRMSSRAFSK